MDTSIRDALIETVQHLLLALEEIQQKHSFHITYKNNEDPLTSADLFSHSYLQTKLREILPEAAFLSEESAQRTGITDTEYLWVVDPIDGTREFVKNSREFSVSIGLIQHDRVVAGVVGLAEEGWILYGDCEEFSLQKYDYVHNTKEIINSFSYETKPIEKAKILVSKTEHKNGVFQNFPEDWNILPRGSIARKLALVAAGEGDMVISLYPKNLWDICGGMALLIASRQLILSSRTYENAYFEEIKINRENLLSYGLVAGNPHLVKKYLQYHYQKKIPLYSRYG